MHARATSPPSTVSFTDREPCVGGAGGPPILRSTHGITYELSIRIRTSSCPTDNWVLDHDFGFADRPGIIENFSVRLLELEPNWQPTMMFNGRWQARNLPPGEGFVVHVPLRYTGTGQVSAVDLGAAPIERGILAVVSLILLASLGRRLYVRERSNGRLDPLPAPASVDEHWLDEYVFKDLPEVVGAAWDNSTGASEVAAVLARLVSEGRLRSEVRPGGCSRILCPPRLLVDRDRFHDYERRLVDALFGSTDRTTDTDRIRQRYKVGIRSSRQDRKPLKIW
jgi:hypothetical protein